MNNSRHRRSIRRHGYDYAQDGIYFVTICIEKRLSLLGEFADEQLRLNKCGEMVETLWLALPSRFPRIALDEYVVMPNHFHGVVVFHAPTITNGATTKVVPTIGDVVGAWKSLTTNAYIQGVEDFGWPNFPKRLWQRNYYEHIIRSERDLDAIREYIRLNPTCWEKDAENPQHT